MLRSRRGPRRGAGSTGRARTERKRMVSSKHLLLRKRARVLSKQGRNGYDLVRSELEIPEGLGADEYVKLLGSDAARKWPRFLVEEVEGRRVVVEEHWMSRERAG